MLCNLSLSAIFALSFTVSYPLQDAQTNQSLRMRSSNCCHEGPQATHWIF